jgi:hypothetical protein
VIIAIDPGCTESAYVLIDDDLRPIEFGKFHNENVRCEVRRLFNTHFSVRVAVEMVASYGMAVGKEVFDTCVWVGRYSELFDGYVTLIYRQEEKLNLCGTKQAKDSNIIQALVDRFACGVPNKGKGSKKAPGWFYGFSKDIWQAYAVGITYYDLYLKGKKEV